MSGNKYKSYRPFTGIGSRETNSNILRHMTKTGKLLAELGYTLRSGKATGSDQAFQTGYLQAADDGIDCRAEIFLPNERFENRFDCRWDIFVNEPDLEMNATYIAIDIHPDWNRCNKFAREAHTRNVFQILGEELFTPTEFVLYAAQEYNNVVSGGTATAVHLARKRGIPVFNFEQGKPSSLKAFLREVGVPI